MLIFILTGKPISAGICLTCPKQAENAEQLTLMSNAWTRCLSPALGVGEGKSEMDFCAAWWVLGRLRGAPCAGLPVFIVLMKFMEQTGKSTLVYCRKYPGLQNRT